MKFCPTCRYYLYMKTDGGNDEARGKLTLMCHNCGYKEDNTKGGLVMETDLEEKTAEGYKIMLNEFTRLDPTLPHTNMIKCPNPDCGSNKGAPRDIIYMKLCNVEGCGHQWRSKGA
jgi:DNA-directed RNA polymerase subunit M/transcription elongation factor TFIIS